MISLFLDADFYTMCNVGLLLSIDYTMMGEYDLDMMLDVCEASRSLCKWVVFVLVVIER